MNVLSFSSMVAMIQEKHTISVNMLKKDSNRIGSAYAMLEELQSVLMAPSFSPEVEQVTLDLCLGRVVAGGVIAKCDAPPFNESLRDGFAVSSCSQAHLSNGKFRSTLMGISGAGDAYNFALQSGQTWKVMTGGRVPENCERVIPQEDCEAVGSEISFEQKCCEQPHFIKKKGSVFQAGAVLIPDGERIGPAHMVTIAASGNSTVPVYRQPRVCFCCTGKELVYAGDATGDAQKVSSNQYLLRGLLERYGCQVHDFGIVADEMQDVERFFNYGLSGDFDLVITTGGTGGGKFDLVETGFLACGGRLICRSIEIRPGKSTLFGEKDGVRYVGLPGPPHAVHTVFLELVVPLLLKLQGQRKQQPQCIEAAATETFRVKTRGNLLLKEGVLQFKNGCCMVRSVRRGEIGNCNILFAPGQDSIAEGDLVELHLREPLF